MRLQELSDFETDRGRIRERLDRKLSEQKSFRGRTGLVEALNSAIDRFNTVQKGDSIILVTDGGDNNTPHLGQAMARLKNAGVRIFVFLFFKNERNTPEEIDGADRLKDMVRTTGGGFIPVHRYLDIEPKGMDQSLAAAAYQLASRVTEVQELTIRLPEESDKAERLKLELSKELSKKLSLEYPSRILPCEASALRSSTQP